MSAAGQLHQQRAIDLDAETLYRLLRLRVDVFVVEQACPYPELDGRDLDPSTRHHWIADDDQNVLATLRVLADPTGADGRPVYRIGRVCTDRGARGKGLTARLLAAALDEIGAHDTVIEAQTYLREMYGKYGFVAEGEEYLEDGIPHIAMRRAASTEPGAQATSGTDQ